MTSLELARKWAYTATLVLLAGFASYDALAKRPPAPVPTPSPARTANDPVPGLPAVAVRDPFVTGAEWRTRMRERLEPTTTPRAPAAASARPPPAPGPDFTLMGTMIGAKGRFAVLSNGQFPMGAVVRGFRIDEVELDRIVLTRGGERFVLRVPGSEGGR